MKRLMRPIAKDEVSYQVTILHQVLEALGLPVGRGERAERRAGPETREKVRLLQRRLQVPIHDDSLLNSETIAAVSRALREQSLTESAAAFTVAGTVLRVDGSAQKRQRLLAFDLDLRGVALYRTATNLSEVATHSGFEFLGEATSDTQGQYQITFYDWQYLRAERKLADVVVYAVEGEQGAERIIGRSRMVHSEDYAATGVVQGLNVIVANTEQRTEYEQVMTPLLPFLKESETTLGAIALSGDQLTFTAGELELELSHLQVAATAAHLLLGHEQQEGLHEPLYGIGRQGIALSWPVLYRKPEVELRAAIDRSVEQRIIRPMDEKQVLLLLATLRDLATRQVLNSESQDGSATLNQVLTLSLPEEEQRLSFLQALNSFASGDFREFWTKHLPQQPAFQERPELVSGLLLTQQLTALTGNHLPLIQELQLNRQVSSIDQLLDLEEAQWLEIVQRTDLPPAYKKMGIHAYVSQIQNLLNAAYPTRRIARMVEKAQIPIEKPEVSQSITSFLAKQPHFDFATSRVHDFAEQIQELAGEYAEQTRSELQKLQRVFQVSPTPEAMNTLLQHNLTSAYSIAHIPRKSFLKRYGQALGGEEAAFAIHQRAEHIALRAENAAMHLREYTMSPVPKTVMDTLDLAAAKETVAKQIPNYAELFGSPDMCECEHCRSVYSASAYFVDLLRFLWRGDTNGDGKSPLDMLAERRPDLLHLPLTCENTNTTIPYIDLANEVMEYYAANDSLQDYEGYDTGEATADELRASPQNFDLEAYRKLKAAPYPFTLPYHQPLDVIRTYSGHLKVSRYEAMKAVNPDPSQTTARAIAAESSGLSPEEFSLLTGVAFDGAASATALHECYGYSSAADLEQMSGVREFLRRSGLAYTDLVELVKTQFINPYQGTLDLLEKLASYSSLGAEELYAALEAVEAGTVDAATAAQLSATVDAYNSDLGSTLTDAELSDWVKEHLDEFRQVITLYQATSACDLDTTYLRTIAKIYEAGATTSGITSATWSKIHTLIRLWRKLGWSLHETDLMLTALGEAAITDQTITMLESVAQLKAATKLTPDQLAVFWGAIDTYGKKSLYKKLFLNKAVQPLDSAFAADAWGDYLQDPSALLIDHQSTILAAFRMTEEELTAILSVAEVIDSGSPRAIDMATDPLHIANLSTIYRYVLLAKALKLKVVDLCKLITLFGFSPFSTWDIQAEAFTSIDPALTYRFYELAAAAKRAGFKASILAYILQGTLPADSNIGLSEEKALQTAKAIRTAFAAIELNHPDTPTTPLTVESLTAKLALTYQPAIVTRFMQILEETAPFDVITDTNLSIAIPDTLAAKYTYVKGSGRLTCAGIMTDAEQAELKALSGATASFQSAVDALYAAPEEFLSTNFSGILTDLPEAYATLLDHPEQPVAATLEERLTYVYDRYLPALKSKLRQDALTGHIAALIGLSEAATAVLIAQDLGQLVTDLSTEGFTSTYTSNSAHLEAYIAAPASGEYTLRVDVADPAETFALYLDGTLILEKTAAATSLSWEVVTLLNAAQMHLLTLEYGNAADPTAIQLQWQTATAAPESIPESVAYPAALLDSFVAEATIYHRAAKFIAGFSLSETELAHLITYNADFGSIDFKALTAEHWVRVSDYTDLRGAVPQAQALLTDLFATANRTSPAPTVDELKALLHQATAWDQASITYLVDTHFNLGVADFRNEIALNRLREVMAIVTTTGLSAETIALWGAAETDFDQLHATAQLIRNGVKAKYEVEDWLELAGELSDTLRKNQQSALVAYLLTLEPIQEWGVEDADGLYEYLLIDVQMDACMDSSRIVQANASIQLFVQRILLNLESNLTGGVEKGVAPDAIDQDRWEWMKNYRVWEANRKVFLYPENWLEPEWRNDRSEFFKELESYLVQNDITDRSVEQAFRNYLTSLNEVANLDICGLHREEYPEGGALKYLHVFARTHNAPYKFFYRRWDEFGKWSAWERVPVDIRSVESTGEGGAENAGVHLLPVVWKDRLFLFWPEFVRVQDPPDTGTKTAEDIGAQNLSLMKPKESFEIRLAWSEYVDAKWTPKQLAKEYLRIQIHDDHPTVEKDYLLTASVDATTQELTINVADSEHPEPRGRFILADIQSPVRAERLIDYFDGAAFDYTYHFSKRRRTSVLDLQDDTYLQVSTDHRLLPVDTYAGREMTLSYPFFFSDAYRTYFVRPVVITIWNRILYPVDYGPILPGLVDDSGFIDWGPIGPEDLIDPDVPGYGYGNTLPGGGFTDPVPGGAISMRTMTMETGATRTMAMRTGGAVMERSVGSTPYAVAVGATQPALGGVAGVADIAVGSSHVRIDTGLEFHTFYHPYSSQFVQRLNQGGLPNLLASDTDLTSDEGSTFEEAYDPNFTHGLVQKPGDFDTRTYYKENVCFDVYGANAIYNWELFFHAPLYIATRLSQNGRFEEAMKWFHYIFDPTTDEEPVAGSETARFWKVLPFRSVQSESLEAWFKSLTPSTDPDAEENAIIKEWRENPFDPHVIAANRPIAYMKHVVMKYVENLIAWGDSLFRQDTRESVYEAIQLYILANHILGPRPEFVPARGEIQAESYKSLEEKWDDFSNALVEMENLFPYSSSTSVSDSSAGTNLLGVGPALYFCIPSNESLLEYWDTVADRLYKIRHCQNIDGVVRSLALFAPPIDPAALIQAASKGLSLGSILADLSSPPPIYRFPYLVQKANEFCGDVKQLGAAMLAALEKKDAEELARLRSSHEVQMLDLMTGIRERQVLEAKALKENLEKGRESARFRLQHYLDLLGNDLSVPDVDTVSASLTADSQLPADRAIPTIETDVDAAQADSEEAGVKLINRELRDITLSDQAGGDLFASMAADITAGFLGLIPQFDAEGTPLGVGAGAGFGGRELGWFAASGAKMFATSSQLKTLGATKASKMASYIRREQEWTLQANLAAKEIIQLDKQVTAAAIRIQVAEKELENHKQQIAHAQEVELFLKQKFTNQELYQWMKEQLFSVYKQSYNLAFEMAKKAEQAYKFEMGLELASFIQYGYWENSQQGLVAGEKLQLALRQLEKAYLEENRRELELTKSISLAQLNPLALIELRETGTCTVSVPEELFDLDFQGHYFRRIKAVRLSIPCIAGPYTSISCTLRLLQNSVRIKTSMNAEGNYEHEHDEGLPLDDARFRSIHVPTKAIATSTAQQDSGMFELDFRDERYLPFERAGAISTWQIELTTDTDLRQFDYATIADVILHMSYTARESGGLFKEKATTHIKEFLQNSAELSDQPLLQLLSMRHDYPSEWHRFLHPQVVGGEQVLSFTVAQERFPFFVREHDVVIMKVEAFARCAQAAAYEMLLTYVNQDGDQVTSSAIPLKQTSSYGALNMASVGVADYGLNLEEVDLAEPFSVKLKQTGAEDYTALATQPAEVEDLLLVFHYKLAEPE